MSQFSLFRTRRFWPLFVAQFLGALNDNLYRFALVIFIVFELSASSALPAGMLVALSGGVFILPFFLFSALAGQLADRHEKSLLIRCVKLAEIGIMGLGAVGFMTRSPAVLLGALFLMGVHSAFFGPLKYGILPQHLEVHELTGGNGLIQMATYIAILCGAALGGLIAAESRDHPWPVIAAVLGVAVAGYLSARRIPVAPANAPDLPLDWNLARATWRLLRQALGDRETAVLIATISWFWFLGATFLSLVPSYGKELLNADERAVTLLNAAFTIGIGLGSLACERLSRRRIELGLMPPAAIGVTVAAAAVGWLGVPEARGEILTLGSFFASPAASAAFLALAGIGASGALYIVPLNTALQHRAPPAARARVIGAMNVMNALFMVVSAVATTALLALGLTIPAIFLLVAALNLVVVMLAVRGLPEFGQRLRALLASPDQAPR